MLLTDTRTKDAQGQVASLALQHLLCQCLGVGVCVGELAQQRRRHVVNELIAQLLPQRQHLVGTAGQMLRIVGLINVLDDAVGEGRGDMHECLQAMHLPCQLQHETRGTGIDVQCQMQWLSKAYSGRSMQHYLHLVSQQLAILQANAQVRLLAVTRNGRNALPGIGIGFQEQCKDLSRSRRA